MRRSILNKPDILDRRTVMSMKSAVRPRRRGIERRWYCCMSRADAFARGASGVSVWIVAILLSWESQFWCISLTSNFYWVWSKTGPLKIWTRDLWLDFSPNPQNTSFREMGRPDQTRPDSATDQYRYEQDNSANWRSSSNDQCTRHCAHKIPHIRDGLWHRLWVAFIVSPLSWPSLKKKGNWSLNCLVIAALQLYWRISHETQSFIILQERGISPKSRGLLASHVHLADFSQFRVTYIGLVFHGLPVFMMVRHAGCVVMVHDDDARFAPYLCFHPHLPDLSSRSIGRSFFGHWSMAQMLAR